MLVKNKRTGQEYTLTEDEWVDIVKNKLTTKFNILQRNAESKKIGAPTEVVNFIKKIRVASEQPKPEPEKTEGAVDGVHEPAKDIQTEQPEQIIKKTYQPKTKKN